MNGGPIGGIKQQGEWLIDARFNKPDLLLRCQKIAEYRDRIFISDDDGIDFVRRQDVSRTLFFIDPPTLPRENRFT
jgi:DNA adenine methylase